MAIGIETIPKFLLIVLVMFMVLLFVHIFTVLMESYLKSKKDKKEYLENEIANNEILNYSVDYYKDTLFKNKAIKKECYNTIFMITEKGIKITFLEILKKDYIIKRKENKQFFIEKIKEFIEEDKILTKLIEDLEKIKKGE